MIILSIHVCDIDDLLKLMDQQCWYDNSHKTIDITEQQWPILLTWFNFNPSIDK